MFTSDDYFMESQDGSSAQRSPLAKLLLVTFVTVVSLLFGILIGILGLVLFSDNPGAITELYQWLPRAGLVVLGGLFAIMLLRP